VSVALLQALAAQGRLYPAVILHGGSTEARQEAAVELARTLLCDAPAERRPCGQCRHCRRITWPQAPASRSEPPAFHPDFTVLLRDLKTVTSVGAARELLATAQLSPFEARGQVFVVADAQSLSPEASNALLKTLEEPHESAPRHFLLLVPSRHDLLPTLRSRALSLFLGPAEPLTADEVRPLAEAFGGAVSRWAATGAAIYLLVAAQALAQARGFEDPRAGRPWALAARAVLEAGSGDGTAPPLRRALLALAEDLLEGPALRLRGIPERRILEGLVARRLAEVRG
jgi:hypothetical protein